MLSNSILIVEFAHYLLREGHSVREAISTSCRIRLHPILMTSLATVIGLLPMALKMGEGSEQYAPLAQAIIGGLALSVLLTVFLVPGDSFLLTAIVSLLSGRPRFTFRRCGAGVWQRSREMGHLVL